jgi:hypothetical protein
MTDKNFFIVQTATHGPIDLTKGKELRSNNLYPFGIHNYAIYHAPIGVYIKGTNTGLKDIMLDQFEVIPEAEALAYKHPYYREE